jgi:hypothetical protein
VSKPQLELTQDQFEGLHDDLDKVRRTSRTVKVDKDALSALLRDHSRLLYLQRGEYEEAEKV